MTFSDGPLRRIKLRRAKLAYANATAEHGKGNGKLLLKKTPRNGVVNRNN